MLWISVIGGLLLLIFGGEALVRGSVALARKLKLSDLFVGVVLVGFGTSLPELVTSLSAVREGSAGLAIGNVVGSNIANILLVLGLAGFIRPIVTDAGALARDGAVMVGSTLALVLLIYFNGFAIQEVGYALIAALLLVTLVTLFTSGRSSSSRSAEIYREEAEFMSQDMPIIIALLLAISGVASIVFGADLLVGSAVELARGLAVSETVIGLTIVAVGTSLPELFTCVIAAARGKSGVALGGVFGSNIFNILGILGVTTIVQPFNIPFHEISIGRDLGALILSMLFVLLFAFTGKKLARWEALIMLAGYATYMYLLLK